MQQDHTTENFLFFATFDKQRYFLDSAQACIASPIKKKRSPREAEEYLTEAAKQKSINGNRGDESRSRIDESATALFVWVRGVPKHRIGKRKDRGKFACSGSLFLFGVRKRVKVV